MGDSIRGDKSICLPVENEKEYRQIIKDANIFRQYIAQTCNQHPEIFPTELEQGFWFHDWLFMDSRDLLWERSLNKYNPDIKAHSRIFCDGEGYFSHQSARFN